MKIVITGVNGFIGGQLAAAFLKRGDDVTGISRSEPKFGNLHHFIRAKLGERAGGFQDADLVVHCAHDVSPGSMQLNIEGTQQWFGAARRGGAKQQLFLTSVSARQDSPSEYGRAKYQLEEFFKNQGQLVLRPGLVAGPGGIFGSLVNILRRAPVVPVLGGNQIKVRLTDIQTLTGVILSYKILKNGAVYNLFQPESTGMADLCREIRQYFGRNAMLVPIPVEISKLLLRIVGWMGLPSGLNCSSFAALVQSQDYDYRSSYAELGLKTRAVQEMVETVYERPRKER